MARISRIIAWKPAYMTRPAGWVGEGEHVVTAWDPIKIKGPWKIWYDEENNYKGRYVKTSKNEVTLLSQGPDAMVPTSLLEMNCFDRLILCQFHVVFIGVRKVIYPMQLLLLKWLRKFPHKRPITVSELTYKPSRYRRIVSYEVLGKYLLVCEKQLQPCL